MPGDTEMTKAPPDEPTAGRDEPAEATTALTAGHEPAEATVALPAVKRDRDDLAPATKPASPTALPLPGPEASSAPTRLGQSLDATSLAIERPRGPHRRRDPERYQILGEHGRGGLGCVSRAHDLDLDRDIAIKELISRGHTSEARFMREALITARLEHPGIVPVYEAGRWPDGTPFYAMKLVAGRPLRDLLAERTTVAARIGLLHHVIAVADALAYAHGRNIIHRDLKPANVIVGEFGETIVIDWGLAKDLTASEEPVLEAGPYRVHHDDGVTRTGAVLGTPTYMPPEQERGEPVDQRADVFAIGAMLWELCSLQRVPPTEPRLRHRMLRRARIDGDLITIIDKALDPDPARRYLDAGALASDLKAFKSGARIAARSYSLPALLAHWTRRHRALAASIVSATLLVVAGSALYIRNIAVERNRADAALDRVETTKNALVRERAELALKHAQLLLTTDPSAAMDALGKYDGTDSIRADQLRAEAVGRGVAVLRAVPHSDSILWVQGTSDRAVVSFSLDGTISRTLPNGQSVVLASGVSANGLFSYAQARHLLAYACNPGDVCVLDIVSGVRVLALQDFRESTLAGMAFSRSGARLAVVTEAGVLDILDISDLSRPLKQLHISVKNGASALFIGENAVAVGTPTGITLVHLAGGTQDLQEPEGTLWDAGPEGRDMAIATTRGEGLLIGIEPLQVTHHATLCRGTISGLKFIPGKPMIAFTCREGDVSTWNFQDGTITLLAHVDGHADSIEVDTSGAYVIVSCDKGVLTVIDLDTNLVSSYKSHEFRLVAISPPTLEFRYILSADVRGGLRAWPLPSRAARVAANVHVRFMSAIYDERADTIIAATLMPNITSLSSTGEVQPIGPHDGNAPFIANAEDGSRFATYGSGGLVEIWSSLPIARTRILHLPHDTVSHVAFVSGTDEVVTSGTDGLLVRSSPASNAKVIARLALPIVNFVTTGTSGVYLVSTNDGTLWYIKQDESPKALAYRGSKVTLMRLMPDAISVCVGFADGAAILIDTISLHQTFLFHAAGAIRDIAFSQDGQIMAIAANDDTIHLSVGSTEITGKMPWIELHVRARRITLTPDKLLVIISTDGAVWTYSIADSRWGYLSTGTVDLTHVILRRKGKTGAIFDAEGRILWINIEAIQTPF